MKNKRFKYITCFVAVLFILSSYSLLFASWLEGDTYGLTIDYGGESVTGVVPYTHSCYVLDIGDFHLGCYSQHYVRDADGSIWYYNDSLGRYVQSNALGLTFAAIVVVPIDYDINNVKLHFYYDYVDNPSYDFVMNGDTDLNLYRTYSEIVSSAALSRIINDNRVPISNENFNVIGITCDFTQWATEYDIDFMYNFQLEYNIINDVDTPPIEPPIDPPSGGGGYTLEDIKREYQKGKEFGYTNGFKDGKIEGRTEGEIAGYNKAVSEYQDRNPIGFREFFSGIINGVTNPIINLLNNITLDGISIWLIFGIIVFIALLIFILKLVFR